MLKLIGRELLFCRVCNRMYNEDNKPHILSCGNTLCHICLVKFTQVLLDRKDKPAHFENSHHHVQEDAPVNYAHYDIVLNFLQNLQAKEKLDNIETFFNNEDLIEDPFECPYIINFHKNNLLNGFYTITREKYSYTGNFINGKKDGDGVYVQDNFNYKGKFSEDQPNGKGRLSLFDSHGREDIYEGIFLGEFKNGKGAIQYSDGSNFEGEWRNFKKEGEGYLVYPNGDFFKGNFHNDLLHGNGEMHLRSQKLIIQGHWKDSKKDGDMILTDEDTLENRREFYKDNVLVTKENEN